MAPVVPTVKLNNGLAMPIFGLGTWKSKPGEVTQTVKDAIDVGYRLIDGAFAYQNEPEVGAAIAAKIKDGTVKREDLFITSKLWGTYHRADLVIPALKKTLSDLGLDYLDLYLIHWPIALKEGTPDLYPSDDKGVPINSDSDFVDTWKSMEEAVKQGLVRSIGVSNFNSEQINRILAACTIKPVTNQVECHPYFNQKKLQEFCKSKDIVITGYSPLGSPDRPWATADDEKLLDNPKLIELGKKYGKSPAQVVLRWLVQRGIITIPKTVRKARLIENLNIFDFTLTEEDNAVLFGLNRPKDGRLCPETHCITNKFYPFHIEF